MRHLTCGAVVLAFLAAVSSAWAVVEESAGGGQPASPPTGPAPLASLSRLAQQIAASMEPDWTLKDSGRDARPAGWSGEAPCERLRFVHKTPFRQGGERTVEIWLSPKSYKGDRLPFLLGGSPAARLHSVSQDRLLFLRVDYIGDDDPAMADLVRMLAQTYGFHKAEDRERTPESVQGQGPPPLQPQWSERTRKAVAEIESQIDETYSSVSYIGPPVPGNPYLMVEFEYREVPLPVIYPPGSVVYLPKRFRRQWLHDLAKQGFFDRANVLPRGQGFERPQGPTYLLCVTSRESCWWEDLGWNAETGRRLDALRKALVGDAAQAMDTLLERLGPDRKEWERAAVGQPASPPMIWGKTAEGLACGVGSTGLNIIVLAVLNASDRDRVIWYLMSIDKEMAVPTRHLTLELRDAKGKVIPRTHEGTVEMSGTGITLRRGEVCKYIFDARQYFALRESGKYLLTARIKDLPTWILDPTSGSLGKMTEVSLECEDLALQVDTARPVRPGEGFTIETCTQPATPPSGD